MAQFPNSFLWGAATSSYQVEGNNVNADWWEWELRVGKEASGIASGHYERYEQDFDLAQRLHHNAHRLSLEWARIEPQEGRFSQEELQHYIEVIKALRARNIEPMVTLHHFTNPLWLSQQGGWTNKKSVACYERFCEFVVTALAKDVKYWITINEPTIYSSHAFIFGTWPPQEKSIWKAKQVQDNHIWAHIKAFERINKIYKDQGLVKPMISISQHVSAIIPCRETVRNRLAVRLRDQIFNYWILDNLMREGTLDFIGLNYYSRHLVETKNWSPGSLLFDTCQDNHHPLTKNSLGWDIYPQGLCEVLVKLNRYRLPIIITENGICTADDNQRWDFIQSHLKSIHEAMDQGVAVGGYLYWSLLDNFEWHQGFGPRFGLIDVNYQTQTRTVRQSALNFAQVCQSGHL